MKKPFSTNSITIDHNIPVPSPRTPAGFALGLPIDKLNVGDSFAVPSNFRGTRAKTAGYLSSMAGYYVKTRAKNKKFTTRQMGSKVRIWRTK